MHTSIVLSLDALVAVPLPDAAPPYARRLSVWVANAAGPLLALEDGATTARPAPGKWSPREIIGHLVDSASNNHQRFVRMRERNDLVVEGYEQDAWVAAQHYQEAPWNELVMLWMTYNRHLARLMAATPPDDRERLRTNHNLHLRAFRPVPSDRPVTLEYFMNDYVDHLEHHLLQILGPME
ncbi:MAG TPA: DinB family protein [Gemmatimonadaceae bacterium]|nr:DinB family protein [Gemmatimonadaceae bacterium]